MNGRSPSVDPRLRVLYVLGLGVGVFFLPALWQVGAVLALQLVLWPLVGLPLRKLLRQVRKLAFFFGFILLSYVLMGEAVGEPRALTLTLPGSEAFTFDATPLLEGLKMVFRVLALVLASQVARAGDPRAIAQGLSRMWVPAAFAVPLDTSLALLGDGGGHVPGSGQGGGRGRRGGGGGGGRGHGGVCGASRDDVDVRGAIGVPTTARDGHAPAGDAVDEIAEPAPHEGFLATAKRLGRGDMLPLLSRLDRQIHRAERHLEAQGRPVTAATRDLAVVSGLALTMLGIRALKVLPSLPFAPGHKLVILTPLYVVASLKTKGRFGATLTGLTMGVVSFLLGDGKYGILEVFKHVVPGLLCDLLVPPLVRLKPGRLAWSTLGVILAVGRFGTIFVTTLLVQPPAIAYAFLLPGLAIHCTFGALSGYVSYGLVRAIGADGPAAERAALPLSNLPPKEHQA